MGKGFEESSPKQTKMDLKFMKNVLWRKGKLKLHWYHFSPISWENPKVWEHTLLVRLWANIAGGNAKWFKSPGGQSGAQNLSKWLMH